MKMVNYIGPQQTVSHLADIEEPSGSTQGWADTTQR